MHEPIPSLQDGGEMSTTQIHLVTSHESWTGKRENRTSGYGFGERCQTRSSVTSRNEFTRGWYVWAFYWHTYPSRMVLQEEKKKRCYWKKKQGLVSNRKSLFVHVMDIVCVVVWGWHNNLDTSHITKRYIYLMGCCCYPRRGGYVLRERNVGGNWWVCV